MFSSQEIAVIRALGVYACSLGSEFPSMDVGDTLIILALPQEEL